MRPAVRGENHSGSKLTGPQVREIKRRFGTESCKEIAEDYPVSESAIYHIKTGRTWAHV